MAAPSESTNHLRTSDWTLLQYTEEDEKQPVIHVSPNTQQRMNRMNPNSVSTPQQAIQLLVETANQVNTLSDKVAEQGETISFLVQQNLNLGARLSLQKGIADKKIKDSETRASLIKRWAVAGGLLGMGMLLVGPWVLYFAGGVGIPFVIEDGAKIFIPDPKESPTNEEVLNFLEKNETFNKEEAIIHLWGKKLAKDNLGDDYQNFTPPLPMLLQYQKRFPKTSTESILRTLFTMHRSHYVNPVIEKEREYQKEHPDCTQEQAIYGAFEKHAKDSGFAMRKITKGEIQNYRQENQGKANPNSESIGISYYHTLQRDATREDAIRDLLMISFLNFQEREELRRMQERDSQGDGRGSTSADFDPSGPSSGGDVGGYGGYSY